MSEIVLVEAESFDAAIAKFQNGHTHYILDVKEITNPSSREVRLFSIKIKTLMAK